MLYQRWETDHFIFIKAYISILSLIWTEKWKLPFILFIVFSGIIRRRRRNPEDKACPLGQGQCSLVESSRNIHLAGNRRKKCIFHINRFGVLAASFPQLRQFFMHRPTWTKNVGLNDYVCIIIIIIIHEWINSRQFVYWISGRQNPTKGIVLHLEITV